VIKVKHLQMQVLFFCSNLERSVIIMSILSGLFQSRDKPTNSTNDSAYRFLFGGSNSGKALNERSAMQLTAVTLASELSPSLLLAYRFMFINTPTQAAKKRQSPTT